APTIAAMVLKGADTNRIKAQIGPCLQKHNLKIGREAPEIYDMFKQTVGHTEFLTDHPHEDGKILFDNAGMIIAQLQEAGVTAIEADETCTLDQAEHYYSYRYRQHDAAHENMRNVSLIWRED
ncbi:MAG TPA: laccase domain-containing protein, partial [Alphaproteobacteria bacterium]